MFLALATHSHLQRRVIIGQNFNRQSLRFFDAASGGLDVPREALTIVVVVIAAATGDTFRAGAAFEVRVARIVDAVATHQFESWLALTLWVRNA
jgi:hypothetical protein